MNYHIIKKGNQWGLKKESNKRCYPIIPDKKKIIQIASKKMTLGDTLYIHRGDASVEKKVLFTDRASRYLDIAKTLITNYQCL